MLQPRAHLRVYGGAFSSVAIAVFGFFVWEHHMFIMGVSQYSALVFSLLTMLVAVPSAIKTFNWVTTLYKGSITFDAPMVYIFCFIGLLWHGELERTRVVGVVHAGPIQQGAGEFAGGRGRECQATRTVKSGIVLARYGQAVL